MSRNPSSRPSFSPARRWRIGADLLLRTVLMLAVVVMVNYLGSKWFHRYDWSRQKRATLSPRTLSLLRTITNTVNVTLYFDRQAAFYPDIAMLLDAYHTANPKIVIRTVDYNRDPGEAEKTKVQHKLSGMRDMIIFESSGRTKIISGDALTQYTIERIPDEKEPRFRKRAVSFRGEQFFTSMIQALQSDRPFIAYFLQGHNEGSFTNTDSYGFRELGETLAQNFMVLTNLSLAGSTNVPADCNLLVILAPRGAFAQEDLQKLDQYLTQGGRMLVLLNAADSLKFPTGLEPFLQRWGINVLADIVVDPSHSVSGDGLVINVENFGQHPITSPLVNNTLQLILPRPVLKVNWASPPANPPDVTELAFASPSATLYNDHSQPPRSWPLTAAMEQKPPAGLASVRGTARMVVVGDSVFLSNRAIDIGVNRDFLSSAANWLLDHPQWMDGIGPRPVTEFRLQLNQQQKRQLRWLLLGALPGGVLALGWLVWFVRRK